MKPCDYCDSRCERRCDPCSEPRYFRPIDMDLGFVQVRGHVTDRYLSLIVKWPGKRLRFEDEA